MNLVRNLVLLRLANSFLDLAISTFHEDRETSSIFEELAKTLELFSNLKSPNNTSITININNVGISIETSKTKPDGVVMEQVREYNWPDDGAELPSNVVRLHR